MEPKGGRMRATKGMLIASAAASLILGRAIAARADEGKTGGEMVHCAGINACKGQGGCRRADRAARRLALGRLDGSAERALPHRPGRPRRALRAGVDLGPPLLG